MVIEGVSVAAFELLRDNLGRLDTLINGQADDTVQLSDARELETITKLLDDIVAAGEAARQTVLDKGLYGARYATEAALLADLVPGDGEYAIAMDTLKIYRKSGATGAGSWLLATDSLAQFAGTAALEDVADVQAYAEAALSEPPFAHAGRLTGDIRLVKNDSLGEVNAGEITISQGGYFNHPTLGRQQVSRSSINTPMEGAFAPPGNVFWGVWSQTAPATRFGSSIEANHANIFIAWADPASGTLVATGNASTGVAYVPDATDAVLFRGTKDSLATEIETLVSLVAYLPAATAEASVAVTGEGPRLVRALPDRTVIYGENMRTIYWPDYIQDADHDASELTASLLGAPPGMVLNTALRTITFPQVASVGTFAFTLQVTNPDEQSVTASAAVTVAPPANDNPITPTDPVPPSLVDLLSFGIQEILP